MARPAAKEADRERKTRPAAKEATKERKAAARKDPGKPDTYLDARKVTAGPQ